MKNTWKAADVPDELFLRVVDYVQCEKQKEYGYSHRPWALWCDINPRIPVPWKVLMAKGRRLKGRGLLTGCFCGCRGDIELTDAGLAFLQLSDASQTDPETPHQQ